MYVTASEEQPLILYTTCTFLHTHTHNTFWEYFMLTFFEN